MGRRTRNSIVYFIVMMVMAVLCTMTNSKAASEIIYQIDIVEQDGVYLNQFEGTASYFLTNFKNGGMVEEAELFLPTDSGYQIKCSDGTIDNAKVSVFGKYYKYTITENGTHTFRILAPVHGKNIPYTALTFTVTGGSSSLSSDSAYRSVTLSNGANYVTNVPVYPERTVVLQSLTGEGYYYKTNVIEDESIAMQTKAYFTLPSGDKVIAKYITDSAWTDDEVINYVEKDIVPNGKSTTAVKDYPTYNAASGKYDSYLGVGSYKMFFFIRNTNGLSYIEQLSFRVASESMENYAYFTLGEGLEAVINIEETIDGKKQYIPYVYGSGALVRQNGTYEIEFSSSQSHSMEDISSSFQFILDISDNSSKEFTKVLDSQNSYMVRMSLPVHNALDSGVYADNYIYEYNEMPVFIKEPVYFWYSDGVTAKYNYTYFDSSSGRVTTKRNVSYNSGTTISDAGIYELYFVYSEEEDGELIKKEFVYRFGVGYIVTEVVGSGGVKVYTNVNKNNSKDCRMEQIPLFWCISSNDESSRMRYRYWKNDSSDTYSENSYPNGGAVMTSAGIYSFVFDNTEVIKFYSSAEALDDGTVTVVDNAGNSVLGTSEYERPGTGGWHSDVQIWKPTGMGSGNENTYANGTSYAQMQEYGFEYPSVKVALIEEEVEAANGGKSYIETFIDPVPVPKDDKGNEITLNNLPESIRKYLYFRSSRSVSTADARISKPVTFEIQDSNISLDYELYKDGAVCEYTSGDEITDYGSYTLRVSYLDLCDENGDIKSFKNWIEYYVTFDFVIGAPDNPLSRFNEIPVDLMQVFYEDLPKTETISYDYIANEQTYLDVFKIKKEDTNSYVDNNDLFVEHSIEDVHVLHRDWQFFSNIENNSVIYTEDKEPSWDGVEISVPSAIAFQGKKVSENEIYQKIRQDGQKYNDDYIVVTVSDPINGNIYYTSDYSEKNYNRIQENEKLKFTESGYYTIKIAFVPSKQYDDYVNGKITRADAYVAEYNFAIDDSSSKAYRVVEVDLEETIEADSLNGEVVYRETFKDKENPPADKNGNAILLPENVDLSFTADISNNGYKNSPAELNIDKSKFSVQAYRGSRLYENFKPGEPILESGSYKIYVSYLDKYDEAGEEKSRDEWIEFVACFSFEINLQDPTDILDTTMLELYEIPHTEFGAENANQYEAENQLYLNIFRFKGGEIPEAVDKNEVFSQQITENEKETTAVLHRRWQFFSNITNGQRIYRDEMRDGWPGVLLQIPSDEAWNGTGMISNSFLGQNRDDYILVSVYDSYTGEKVWYTSYDNDGYPSLSEINSRFTFDTKYEVTVIVTPREQYEAKINGLVEKADAFGVTYSFQIFPTNPESHIYTRILVDLLETDINSGKGLSYNERFVDRTPVSTDSYGRPVPLPTNIVLQFASTINKNGYSNEAPIITTDEIFTVKAYRNGEEYRFVSGEPINLSGKHYLEISYLSKYNNDGVMLDESEWVEYYAIFEFRLALEDPTENLIKREAKLYEVSGEAFAGDNASGYLSANKNYLEIFMFEGTECPNIVNSRDVFEHAVSLSKTNLLHRNWQFFSSIKNGGAAYRSELPASWNGVQLYVPADRTWNGKAMLAGNEIDPSDYVVVKIYDTYTGRTLPYTSNEEYNNESGCLSLDEIGKLNYNARYEIEVTIAPASERLAQLNGEKEKAEAYYVSFTFVIADQRPNENPDIDDFNEIEVSFKEEYYLDIMPPVDIQAYKAEKMFYRETFLITGQEDNQRFADWVFHSSVQLLGTKLPAYNSVKFTMPQLSDLIIFELTKDDVTTKYTNETADGLAPLENITGLGTYYVRMGIVKHEDLSNDDLSKVNIYTIKFSFTIKDASKDPGGDLTGDRKIVTLSLYQQYIDTFGADFSEEEYNSYINADKKFKQTFTDGYNMYSKWSFYTNTSFKNGNMSRSPLKLIIPQNMYENDYMVVHIDYNGERKTYTNANDNYPDITDLKLTDIGLYKVTMEIVPQEDLSKKEAEQTMYRVAVQVQLYDASDLHDDDLSKRKIKDAYLVEFMWAGGDLYKEVFEVDGILRDKWYFFSDAAQDSKKLYNACITIPGAEQVEDYFIIYIAKDTGRNTIEASDDYKLYTRETGYEELKNIDEAGSYLMYVGIVQKDEYETLPEEEQVEFRAKFKFQITDKVEYFDPIEEGFNWVPLLLICLGFAIIIFIGYMAVKKLYLDKKDGIR